MMLKRISTSALFLILVSLALPASAYNNELEWRSLATEHFDVHYHVGAEWTAQQVAQIAEEIYPHITGLYEYEPKRCDFVILDTQDYANGAAYFYDNKIEIWATNLEFGFRGTTQWLRNVVTHEFAHIVSIQAAMKMPLRVPAIYFQMVGFENEKRPDVITGYPNLIVSYPLPGAIVPPWWAEGVAQYQSATKQYDCWDTHRDMILRASVTDDEMMSYEQMGYLGHQSIDNEKVYDHGYGLVRYIAETYGDKSIKEISIAMGKWNRLTIDGAIKDATGKSGKDVYKDWQQYLGRRYDKQLQPIHADPREGWVFTDDGYINRSPSYSPDGKRVAFLSNRGYDFSTTALYVADADGKNVEKIRGAVSSRAVFSPDGSRLLFAAHKRSDKYNAKLSDLIVFEFGDKKPKQITHKLRASQPQYSPDGEKIVCIINGDGTHHIATLDASGENMRVLYQGDPGTQFYEPSFSPDGSRIMFGIFEVGTRDVVSIAADGTDFRYIIRTMNDERDARWVDDGRSVLFASDRNGIFNIYKLDLDTDTVVQMTNVIGGAFTPAMSPTTGAVAYAEFRGKGYHIAVLDPGNVPVETLTTRDYALRTTGEFDECVDLKTRQNDVSMAMVGSYSGVGLIVPAVPVAIGVPGEPGEYSVIASQPVSAGAASSDAVESAVDTSMIPASLTVPGDDVSGIVAQRDDGLIDIESTKYKSKFTDWKVFPRVVIWDGVPRLGAFITSSEILERSNFFVAGSYGTDGGFDFLLDFEFRRLYPVFYLQFFRMRQKYNDRALINDTEFLLDIRYDLWAADIGVRFEFTNIYSILHRHELSFWWSHPEYSVHLDPQSRAPGETEFVPEPAVGWPYFKGNEFYARYYFKSIRPAIDSDINPRGGRELRVQFMLARNNLFTSGDFDYGLQPSFDFAVFGQYTVDFHEYMALPWYNHSLQIRLFGSYIDNQVDDFFWIYMGGMDGLRGYTYYTLGGRAGALASATYRFPILRHINRQLSWLTFKDIYGAVFFETANAWDDEGFETQGYKRAAGYELRFNMGSFYAYPTTINIVGAYALDEAIFFNPLLEFSVVHEPQWRHYLTIGFTF